MNDSVKIAGLFIGMMVLVSCGPSEAEVKKQQEEYRKKINEIMKPYERQNKVKEVAVPVDSLAIDSLQQDSATTL